MEGLSILDQRQPRLTPDQKKKIELQRGLELADVRSVLSTVEGRRFFWRLLNEAQTFSGAFTGNSNTFFILGKQDLGKILYRDAHAAALDLFRLMEDEAANRDQANKKGV